MKKVKNIDLKYGQKRPVEIYFANEVFSCLSPPPAKPKELIRQISTFLFEQKNPLFKGDFRPKTFIKKLIPIGETYDIYYATAEDYSVNNNNPDPFKVEVAPPLNITIPTNYVPPATCQIVNKVSTLEREKADNVFADKNLWKTTDLLNAIKLNITQRLSKLTQPTPQPTLPILNELSLPKTKVPSLTDVINNPFDEDSPTPAEEFGLEDCVVNYYIFYTKQMLSQLHLFTADVTAKKNLLDKNITSIFGKLHGDDVERIANHITTQISLLQKKIQQIKRLQIINLGEEPITAYSALLKQELNNYIIVAESIQMSIKQHYLDFHSNYEQISDDNEELYKYKQLLKFTLLNAAWLEFELNWKTTQYQPNKHLFLNQKREMLALLLGDIISIDVLYNLKFTPLIDTFSLQQLCERINALLKTPLSSQLKISLESVLSLYPQLGSLEVGYGGWKVTLVLNDALLNKDRATQPYIQAIREIVTHTELTVPVINECLTNEITEFATSIKEFELKVSYLDDIKNTNCALHHLESHIPTLYTEMKENLVEAKQKLNLARNDMRIFLETRIPANRQHLILTPLFIFNDSVLTAFKKIHQQHSLLIAEQEEKLTHLFTLFGPLKKVLQDQDTTLGIDFINLQTINIEIESIKSTLDNILDTFNFQIAKEFEKISLILAAPNQCKALATDFLNRINALPVIDSDIINKLRLDDFNKITKIQLELENNIKFIQDAKKLIVNHINNTFPAIQNLIQQTLVEISQTFDENLNRTKNQQFNFNILCLTHLIVRSLLNFPVWKLHEPRRKQVPIYVNMEAHQLCYSIPIEIFNLLKVVKEFNDDWQRDPQKAQALILALKTHVAATKIKPCNEKHVEKLFNFLNDLYITPLTTYHHHTLLSNAKIRDFTAQYFNFIPYNASAVKNVEIEQIDFQRNKTKPKIFPSNNQQANISTKEKKFRSKLKAIAGGASIGFLAGTAAIFIIGLTGGLAALPVIAGSVCLAWACITGAATIGGGLFGWGCNKITNACCESKEKVSDVERGENERLLAGNNGNLLSTTGNVTQRLRDTPSPYNDRQSESLPDVSQPVGNRASLQVVRHTFCNELEQRCQTPEITPAKIDLRLSSTR